MTHILDSSISNNRNTKATGILRDLVHCCGLGPPTGQHFLGDADGTTSHADSQSIYTCIYEVLGLRSSDYYSETERLMREGPVAESIISPRSVLSSLTIASNDL